MTQRASFEALLDFANKVREAGGGNPIDALMPAVPEDPSACLIARNLNFNCEVDGVSELDSPNYDGRWAMRFTDEATRDAVAAGLGLPSITTEPRLGYPTNSPRYGVVLPEDIGQIAADFDQAGDALRIFQYWTDDFKGCPREIDNCGPALPPAEAMAKVDEDERSLLVEMLPYIEASEAEARAIATLVNPDGSIVL